MAQVNYQPWAMSGLTHVFGNHQFAVATPAACSIRQFDTFETLSQLLTHELPHGIMNIIAADPTSSIAVKYQSYVKTVLLPLCRRVTGILRAHSAPSGRRNRQLLRSQPLATSSCAAASCSQQTCA